MRDPKNEAKIRTLATIELRRQIQAGKVKCNCGGPQYGTDHSPDCEIELAWDRIVAEVREKA